MELQKMFYSPIAWLILIIFAVQTNIGLMDSIHQFVRTMNLGYGTKNLTFSIYSGPFGIFTGILANLYLYIPLLTMGLLSREFGSGSIKLLYSSPISNKQIVLGKFVSMMAFGLAMLVIVVFEIMLGITAIKDFDVPLVLTGLLGMYLLICTYSAIGLFMSSLTSYQIVAAIGTFATLFALAKVDTLWQQLDFVRDITFWMSLNGRSIILQNGLICSEDILYFLLVTGLFILFTLFRLQGLREKSPVYVSVIRYLGTFMVVAIIGYVSTLPALMGYYDASRTKANTLTLKSQEVISKLKGKVKLTTYGNIFDPYFGITLPVNQKSDMQRYEKYRRFYPNMEFEYKYYYALATDANAANNQKVRFKGLTTQQALVKTAENYNMDLERFKPGQDYKEEIDLNSELNRVVTKITDESGKVAYLRFFDDQSVLPDESNITAAFKNLVAVLPVVGFVKGHEQRDVNDFGARGYFTISKQKTFRYALINNGFAFTEFDLSSPVPKHINILVIADVKTDFTPVEMHNLNNYIDRGGNLIIASDVKRQKSMNPLVARFGVKFMKGQVVEHNKGYPMDLVTAQTTPEAQALTYQFKQVADVGGIVSMDGTTAISYKPQDGFKYTRLLVSDTIKNAIPLDSAGSWNELQSTDFVDSNPKYNAESGDALGSQTTALAITRKVNGKDQKIVVLGDADCMSNNELLRFRAGMKTTNFYLVTGMFFWLSDNEVPIDVRRPEATDNEINISKSALSFLNIFYKFIIPGLFLLCFVLIWLRRKGR